MNTRQILKQLCDRRELDLRVQYSRLKSPKLWRVVISLNGQDFAIASGHSKKVAYEFAADRALILMQINGEAQEDMA